MVLCLGHQPSYRFLHVHLSVRLYLATSTSNVRDFPDFSIRKCHARPRTSPLPRMGLKNDRVVKWTNEGAGSTYVGLSGPIAGKVIPIDLQQSGTLLAKPQMFLCRYGTKTRIGCLPTETTFKIPICVHDGAVYFYMQGSECLVLLEHVVVYMDIANVTTRITERASLRVYGLEATCRRATWLPLSRGLVESRGFCFMIVAGNRNLELCSTIISS